MSAPPADPFPQAPEELERAATARVAVQVHATVLPTLDRLRHEALRRSYRVLDLGQPLDADVALGTVLELYAIERLERALRQQVRRGTPGGRATTVGAESVRTALEGGDRP